MTQPTMQQLVVGPVPSDETPTQTTDTDFARLNERECRVFQRMLGRLFPVPAGITARFTVKSFPHDFATYREVVVMHDGSKAAWDFALHVEANCPLRWDDQAQAELVWFGEAQRFTSLVRAGTIGDADVPPMYRWSLPPSSLSVVDMLKLRPDQALSNPQRALDSALEFDTSYGPLRLVVSRDDDGDLDVLAVRGRSGLPFVALTVTIRQPRYVIPADEIFVSTWADNAPLRGPLLATSLFFDTGLREPFGTEVAEVWRLTPRFLTAFNLQDLRRAA